MLCHYGMVWYTYYYNKLYERHTISLVSGAKNVIEFLRTTPEQTSLHQEGFLYINKMFPFGWENVSSVFPEHS